MFNSNSRYADTEILSLKALNDNGEEREVRYLRRRFLPPPDTSPTLIEHAVEQGDRIDNITARYIGDPTQFWRICDANNALHPLELTEDLGRVLKITMPQL